jgi:hypothetical protein
MNDLTFKTDLSTTVAFFDENSAIDNSKKEEWNTDSALIQHRVPAHILNKGVSVTVHGYRIDLSKTSKITLNISKGEVVGWVCASDVLGSEISTELNQKVNQYLGWLFGNSMVVEQIVNFTENDISMNLWKESNKAFHDELQKILRVRHMSKKFGL